jgi:hypothetical protein
MGGLKGIASCALNQTLLKPTLAKGIGWLLDSSILAQHIATGL